MQNMPITGAKGQLGNDCLDIFKDVPGVTGN